MRPHPALLLLLAVSTACRRPPEAPTDLDALARFLVAAQAPEADPAALELGVDNLRDLLGPVELDAKDPQDRSWEISPLSRADLSGLDRPGRAPAALLGVAIAHRSPWPLEDHARLQTEADQTPAEVTAEWYDRSFVDPTDPSCFPSADCPILVTDNEVERHNMLFAVSGPYRMDFRWVGEDAVVARGWIPEPWPSEGNATVWQSYRLEVWLRRGTQTWRFQSLWTEMEVAGLSDTAQLALARSGGDELLHAGDDAIGALYHSGAE